MRRFTTGLAAVAVLAGCGGEAAEPETAVSTPGPTTAVRTSTTAPSPTDLETQEAEATQELPPADTAALEAAVATFSDAFLDGEPTEAYDVFSERCKEAVTLSYFTGIVAAAQAQYGAALPIQSFDAKVSEDIALVSYTYAVPALDQASEPWVMEDGAWKLDECG